MFVFDAGLSTLETAADLFLSICGPPRYSEVRLNLAQAVQAVGSSVAPLPGSQVIFARTVNTAQASKLYNGYGDAFNRFFASSLMTIRFIKPRYVFATYLGICFIFVLAASQSYGDASIAMLCLVLCWESACFPTIFTLALHGLERHTKIGGSLIVAAISGGAVFPPMTGAVATHLKKIESRRPFHTAMLIPMAGFICAWVYPIYVNIFDMETMDVHRETKVGIEPVSNKELALQQ